MFDTLLWQWDYEPDLQAGYVIPDFVLSGFAHAIIAECKPALTIEELGEERCVLIRKLPSWLSDDVQREITELSRDIQTPVEAKQRALEDMIRVKRGQNPLGRSRRVLVVGPVLHTSAERVTLDGEYGFNVCCDHGEPTHVGLALGLGDACLKCGEETKAWAPADVILNAWRKSQNVAQWQG